jgi:hypothetical protein
MANGCSAGCPWCARSIGLAMFETLSGASEPARSVSNFLAGDVVDRGISSRRANIAAKLPGEEEHIRCSRPARRTHHGFFLRAEKQTIEVDMTTEDAGDLTLSAGVSSPA